MTDFESQKKFVEIVGELTELRKRKNQAYGDGFLKQYNKYGEKALFFDLLRKWSRIESLLFEGNHNNVADETIQDTLGDMAVMCINGMVWMGKNDKRNK